jgi:hypothetical protein
MRHRFKRSFTGLVAVAAAALLIAPLDAGAQQTNRLERINGKPNLNGIWQAANSANWNLEAHSARALDGFWQLGSLASIPAGQSVVVGGEIPYLPEALARREENPRPRATCPAFRAQPTCRILSRSCRVMAIF